MPAEDFTKIARATDAARLFFVQTVYGYQTQVVLGRLRFHIFHREDPGIACHDHPWPFWTFPLTAYVEDVERGGTVSRQIVHRFWPSWRAASHTHRIIGPWSGEIVAGVPQVKAGRIFTLVWRGRGGRAWHYVVARAGKVHRVPWRRYLELADRD